MDKIKRWHVFLIATVLLLTIYNILPTLIYYSKPLSQPIDQKQAFHVAEQIVDRVQDLEKESLDWTRAFAKNLGVKPKHIQLVENNPQLIEVQFEKSKDAQTFKKFLPRAGSLIGFVPAQLGLAPDVEDQPNRVLVERKISFLGSKKQLHDYFQYASKTQEDLPSSLYHELTVNRITQVTEALAGPSSQALLVEMIPLQANSLALNQGLMETAQTLLSYESTFGDSSPMTKRYLQGFSLSKGSSEHPSELLLGAFKKLQNTFQGQLDSEKIQADTRKQLIRDIETLKSAQQIVARNARFMDHPIAPLTSKEVKAALENYAAIQNLSFGDRNPFISSLTLNWEKGFVQLNLHSDVETFLESASATKLQKEKLNQLIINEVAKTAQASEEEITPTAQGYQIALNQLMDSESLLILDLKAIAKQDTKTLLNSLREQGSFESPDLSKEAFPVWSFEEYQNLSTKENKFGLVVYAPVLEKNFSNAGFKNSSIYVIAKGLDPIFNKYQQYSDSPEALQFEEDFSNLQKLLQQQGFQLSYQAQGSQYPKDMQKAIIFEKPNYYGDLLAATRENFIVRGNKEYATLEFTDLEQRLLAENKIETAIHEELIKASEDRRAAVVDLQDPMAKFMIPPVNKNVYWNNFKLSFKEYFRGDSRKILKWGLDLSGGRSILIGLRDQNNRPVTNKADLTEGVNELTQRVNKMGLSEVDIRVEGSNIALDFPSSKGLSAQELIKGSTMYFHVVNEKFSSNSSPYYVSTQKFLQEVWNEAVITNRKDAEGIQAIAWKHLGGLEDGKTLQPRTEHAKVLVENGLVLASPTESYSTSKFNDEVSTVAMYGGSDFTEWRGQSNPLLIVYNNYALEGAQIENIRTAYDPSQGNSLAFNIKGSYTNKLGKKMNPSETLYNWTSVFAKDRVQGTDLERYSPGRGWRLAIILNGRVINDPGLNQALRDNVQVTGGFTQHEVNKLAADLKAGSLTFKPQILSEENVSADLGQKERTQGILATLIALALVIALMIVYYHFAGVVASVAVLINLLIIWATLQNLQATLTLSGIAGIILTLGMAVDANVLVFERIREELKKTSKLSTAIYTGYKQAFSAIFDSNVTTIIAALILLNFDTGPIKGLAITLTIGITSSMFTALFMTRVFFVKWLQHTKAKTLSMASWFQVSAMNFLKHARWVSALFLVIILAGGALLVTQHRSILGMDFTGGYSLNLQLEPSKVGNYRKQVEQALIQAGAKSTDFQVRELNQANFLRVQLSSALEEKGRPFYGLPTSVDRAKALYAWESNPRITWVVAALESQGLILKPQSLEQLEKNWSEMSGQLSKTTRNNALIGLTLAMFFILIYISFRFEVKFAISAILCIVHDVLITLAILALLHLFHVPIQINMQIIAALMTIIGYSLNDTIIVFDRIREEKKLMKKATYAQVINHSLSITLGRTLMTSLTTFVVLLALVILGGAKIFDFSLMMSIGVVVGTLSSLFVAPLLLHYFHSRETKEVLSTPVVKNGSTA